MKINQPFMTFLFFTFSLFMSESALKSSDTSVVENSLTEIQNRNTERDIFTFGNQKVNDHPDQSWQEFDIKIVGKPVRLMDPECFNIIFKKIYKSPYMIAADFRQQEEKITDNNQFINEDVILNYYKKSIQYRNTARQGDLSFPAKALKYALFKKISTYSNLKELLLATGNAKIIYDSSDSTLGRNSTNNSLGSNLLGETLMQIRNEQEAQEKENIQKAQETENIQKAIRLTALQSLKNNGFSWWKSFKSKLPERPSWFTRKNSLSEPVLNTTPYAEPNIVQRFFNWIQGVNNED